MMELVVTYRKLLTEVAANRHFAEAPLRVLAASDAGLRESDSPFQVDFVDALDDWGWADDLSGLDVDMLVLCQRGYSAEQISWLLNRPWADTTSALDELRARLADVDLVTAGVIAATRYQMLVGRYARRLKSNLQILVGAQVLRVETSEEACGLGLMLANGQQVKLWFAADDELERPGWAVVEDVEGGHFWPDEMEDLQQEIENLVGKKVPYQHALREQLHAIVERAISILDHMDGDPDLEENSDENDPDYEDESFVDQDVVPLTLNPSHQKMRIIEEEMVVEPATPLNTLSEPQLLQLPPSIETQPDANPAIVASSTLASSAAAVSEIVHPASAVNPTSVPEEALQLTAEDDERNRKIDALRAEIDELEATIERQTIRIPREREEFRLFWLNSLLELLKSLHCMKNEMNALMS